MSSKQYFRQPLPEPFNAAQVKTETPAGREVHQSGPQHQPLADWHDLRQEPPKPITPAESEMYRKQGEDERAAKAVAAQKPSVEALGYQFGNRAVAVYILALEARIAALEEKLASDGPDFKLPIGLAD